MPLNCKTKGRMRWYEKCMDEWRWSDDACLLKKYNLVLVVKMLDWMRSVIFGDCLLDIMNGDTKVEWSRPKRYAHRCCNGTSNLIRIRPEKILVRNEAIRQRSAHTILFSPLRLFPRPHCHPQRGHHLYLRPMGSSGFLILHPLH